MAEILFVAFVFAFFSLVLCGYYYLAGILDGLKRSDGYKALQEYRTETVNHQSEKVNNGDPRTAHDSKATTHVTFRRRGESSRNNNNNLRELRKHQRSMKLKYHENSENLLYYCFYKGITEQYYKTLRQC